MPTYKCDCCKFSTHIKSHFDKHNETKKHLNNIDNYTEPMSPKSEIQELKDMVVMLCAKVSDLEESIDECKEIIKKRDLTINLVGYTK